MQPLWQEVVVALLVIAASAYLARRAWSIISARRQGGCGSACGGCGSKEPANVVELKPPKPAK